MQHVQGTNTFILNPEPQADDSDLLKYTALFWPLCFDSVIVLGVAIGFLWPSRRASPVKG